MKHRRILALLLVLCLAATCVFPAAAVETLKNPATAKVQDLLNARPAPGTAVPAATDETVIAVGTVVVDTTLNVRSGPGTSYSKVGTLPGGIRVAFYETKTVGSTTWGRMDLGWISLSYVILDEDLEFTDAGYCGTGEDVLWGYAEKAKLLVIIGEGPMVDYPYNASIEYLHPWVWYGEEIRTLVVNTGITYIGDCTFNDCTNLSYVYIADTVTGMGDAVFEGCTALEQIVLPDSITSIGSSTFSECTNLEYVLLPGGLTEIGIRMFQNCTSLAEVEIPAGVTAIKHSAFDNCTALTNVSLPEALDWIGSYAFTNCRLQESMTIPKGVTYLSSGVFSYSTALKEITFLGNVLRFESDTFVGVEADVYYPDNNFTWSESVRQDYGGTLTWHAIEIPGSENPVISGTCGDALTWTLADGVLTISGTGEMYDYYSDPAPWSNYVSAITQVILPEGLASIGDYAFSDIDGLTAVTIPDGVKRIGDRAFRSTGLTAVTIPDSVTTMGREVFWYCEALTSATLPVDLEVIADRSFYKCTALKEITIPAQVKTIEVCAFAHSGLEKITFLGDAPSIGADVFSGVVATAYYPAGNETWTEDAMPTYDGNITWEPYGEPGPGGLCGENLTWSLNGSVLTISGEGEMKDYLFPSPYSGAPWYPYADQITSVVVKPGVTTIGEYAFAQLYSLKKVTLPEGLLRIGMCAFSSSNSIESVNLPESLEEICPAAFMGMGSLREITIPAATTVIGEEAFMSCGGMKAIRVAEGNPNYSSDGCGVLFNKDKTELIVCPAGFEGEYVIPEGVELLWNKAFASCGSLTDVEIPASVTTIDNFAFHFCDALTQVRFLGDAPEIGSQVFTQVTAAVYYPAGNDTWNAGTMLDYDGTLTWLPYSNGAVMTSGWSGETTWTLTDDGILTVSGSGAMKNYTNKSAMPWYAYRDQIIAVYIEDGVTAIGDYAFYGMPALRVAMIADTVTTVGHYAFKNSTALTAADLPDGLTQLGESAFYGCSSLKAIDIPASLWTVKPYTFKNCTGLKEVTFHEGNLQKISDGAFYNTGMNYVDLPECLDILDSYTFKNCADLWIISLPSGLTEIREAVFYGTAVEELTIPEGIIEIDGYAFKKCAALQTVSLPESLRTIGESAFMDCPALTEVNVPAGVTAIGGYAFKRCTALNTLTLSAALEDLGESTLHTCTALKTLTIPENVATIGGYCFSASGLEEITFTGDAPAIGPGVFNKVTATAYYPGTNATWTADVMQPYGGTITWTAK